MLYKTYSDAVGRKIGSGACAQVHRANKLQELEEDNALIVYLSLSDVEDIWEGDWLFRVINDIVSSCSIGIALSQAPCMYVTCNRTGNADTNYVVMLRHPLY